MKKIIIVCIVLVFCIPVAKAGLYDSSTLTLSVTSGEVNNEFNFLLQDTSSGATSTESVITQNSDSETRVWRQIPLGSFYLTPIIPKDWQLNGFGCWVPPFTISGFSYGPEGSNMVEIYMPNYRSNILCSYNFSRTKISKIPVLIVPGIMGTEINKGAELLWPDIPRMINPAKSDTFMDPLAFNTDGLPTDTSLTTGDVIREPYSGQHFYDGIIQNFETQGYMQNEDLFVFPYDWRQNIAKTAYNEEEARLPLEQRKDLASKIDQILQSTGANQVNIVAHSQGGLVSKRLLFDRPEYQNKIKKLVFVGTPALGSPQAAKILLYGDNLDIAKKGGIVRGQLDPEEVKKIAQNMPAVYELLPSQSYFIRQPLGYIYDNNLFYLNTSQKTSGYLKNKGLNNRLIDQANIFHNYNYDNFDFSTTGIETYNIAGCEQGTLGTLITKSNNKPSLRFTAGDGTVPLDSAKQVPGAINYYIQGGLEHAKMLSTSTVESLVTNIIAEADVPLANVVSNLSQCHFNGTQLTIQSPVELDIYDENGKHVGISNDDNSPFVDLGVPGSKYEEIGHNKFAYLPVGHIYSVKLTATDAGSFTFDSSVIQEGSITNTAHYDSIVITASSTAQIVLNGSNNQSIQLDLNGDGSTDQIIHPSSILNSEESQDLVPPISTSTIVGVLGEPGFYRSNATVTLSSIDPVIPGRENETSGILKTSYSLDGGEYQVYASSSPISLTTEGPHTIKFYSTDRAGNNEPEQELSFVIDKTPPELVIQFDPLIKDLVFSATDTLPSIVTSTSTAVKVKWPKVPALRFTDSNDIITATDPAGNTIQLILKDKDRKNLLKADIKSLSYNGHAVDISKAKLNFVWKYDKKGTLTHLTQNIQSKKKFHILAMYNGKKTTLAGLDAKGIILKSLNGLVLLKVTTNKGDLSWGY